MKSLRPLVLLCALVASAPLVGCSGYDETNNNPSDAFELDAPEPSASREIAISDESGDNHVIVKLTSEDPELLDSLSERDFTLVTVSGASPGEASGEAAEGSTQAGSPAPGQSSEDAQAPPFELEVVEEYLQEGVTGFLLTENVTPNYRAPFRWRYYYSGLDCADITRTALFNRVWGSISFRSSAASPWQTLASGVRIANNDTLSRCRTPSQRLRVGVRARRTRHYSVQFYN